MTYQEAKAFLRGAIASKDASDWEERLVASPGQLSVIDTSTAGELPEGDSYGDQFLRSLMVIWRHIAGRSQVDSDLIGILVFTAPTIRWLAADPKHDQTRIPQISLILDSICLSSLVPKTGS